MKAFLTLLLFCTSITAMAGDTTGTWIGTMEHKGTGVNKTVWFVKMNLTIEGDKCYGTILYDFMKRNSPLTLEAKFNGYILENTLVINYYSKDIKRIGKDARGLLLQYRYNLVLVKNKFNQNIYGDYIGLSKGLIADQTKGYIFLEPVHEDIAVQEKKIDLKIDSLIANIDNPVKPTPEITLNNLPATANDKTVAKKSEEPTTTDIKASGKKLPDIAPAVITPVEKKDTQAIVKNEPPVVKKDSVVTVKNEPVIKKDSPVVATNNPVVIKEPSITKTEAIASKKDTLSIIKPGSELKLDASALKTAKVEVQAKLQSRENIVTDRLLVDSGEVVVEFYDNGSIDGDIITVIHNKNIVLSNAGLTDKALRFTFNVDPRNPTHEIVMYAENLGSIPPNTALMILTYNNQRKQVFLSADDKKSAVVLLELKR